MENITQLIQSLDSREFKLLQNYYALNPKRESLLRLKLLKIIHTEKNLTKGRVEELIGKNFTQFSFKMLIKRLQEDILKVLLLHRDTDKKVSKPYEAKLRCRRMTIEIDMLMTKGLTGLAIERLKKAERLAKKYELTIDKVLIDEQKQTLLGLRKGLTVYKQSMKENVADLETIKLKFKAKDYYRRLVYPNLFFVNKETSFIDEAKEATQQLKEIYLTDSSAHIKFYYLRSEIYYNHLISNYVTAQKFSMEFLEFVKTNRIVRTNDNMGGANMLASHISLYLNDGLSAVQYATDGLDLFVKGSLNQMTLCENLFLGYLVMKDLTEAGKTITQVSNFKNFKSNQLRQAKWIYYKANLLFLQGKYEESLSILQKQSELLADKSGWRLGYKTLEMMCIVELGNYDWLDYRIETFRKLLSSVKKENIYRAKAVMQVVKNFIKSGYDFQVANTRSKEHLELLTKAEDNFRYDPKGYEVIRFDEWWNSKVKAKTRVKAS